jgi:RNA polymerase sigma-70 factor, ECF subfamily
VGLDGVGDVPDTASDPADVAATRVDLAAALGSISAEMRATVLLVDAEGIAYTEAAEILGIPVGTVRSRLNRARATLRLALNSPEGREAT